MAPRRAISSCMTPRHVLHTLALNASSSCNSLSWPPAFESAQVSSSEVRWTQIPVSSIPSVQSFSTVADTGNGEGHIASAGSSAISNARNVDAPRLRLTSVCLLRVHHRHKASKATVLSVYSCDLWSSVSAARFFEEV
eukprot:6492121-Amphidinium_carterae.1